MVSSPQPHPPSASPHLGFYKRFGRPITKVFFGAVFTYQIVYLVWNKLETDAVTDRKRREILELEAEVKRLR